MYDDIFSNGLAINDVESFSGSRSKDNMFDLLYLQTLNKQNKQKQEEKARKEEQARKERSAKRNSSTFFCMSFKNDVDSLSYMFSSDEEREAIQSEIEANPDEEPDWEIILFEAVSLHAPSALDGVKSNSQTINVQI